jgi:hypothetical protein
MSIVPNVPKLSATFLEENVVNAQKTAPPAALPKPDGSSTPDFESFPPGGDKRHTRRDRNRLESCEGGGWNVHGGGLRAIGAGDSPRP